MSQCESRHSSTYPMPSGLLGAATGRTTHPRDNRCPGLGHWDCPRQPLVVSFGYKCLHSMRPTLRRLSRRGFRAVPNETRNSDQRFSSWWQVAEEHVCSLQKREVFFFTRKSLRQISGTQPLLWSLSCYVMLNTKGYTPSMRLSCRCHSFTRPHRATSKSMCTLCKWR